MEQTIPGSNFQSDTDVSVVKLVSFVASAVISAGVAGYFIAVVDLLWASVALTVFATIFTLQVIFIKSKIRMMVSIFLETLAMTIPSAMIFESGFSKFLFISWGALFLLLLSSEMGGRNQMANSLKIHFFKIARISLSKSIPALLVFVSIVYIFIAGKDLVAKNGAFIADSVITPLVGSFIPGISSESSFKDIIEKTAELRLGKETYDKLPSYVKDESIKQTQEFIERYTGDIDINAPFGQVIYEFFTERLSGADFMTKLYIALTLITIIWFVVKTATWVLYLPIAVIAFLVYELLIVMNFIVIQYEAKSREIILLN